jgi:hypothetical protein
MATTKELELIMDIYLDLEFVEESLEILSLGMVREDNKTLYLENKKFYEGLISVNDWVKENVVPHLTTFSTQSLYTTDMANIVVPFCDENPIFWGYYADYDWVILMKELFGQMTLQPNHWPFFCRDIIQLVEDYGLQEKFKVWKKENKPLKEHHSLYDAKWNKLAHEWIKKERRNQLNSIVNSILGS